MKRQSGFTTAGFTLLLIAFIVQLIAANVGIFAAYRSFATTFYYYRPSIDDFLGALISAVGASGVIVFVLLIASPLLWAVAFRSEAREHFFGRIFGGISMLALSAVVYVPMINFLSSFGSFYGRSVSSAQTILSVIIYGGAAVTLLMLISIFFSVRTTSIISAIGVGIFIGLMFYVLFSMGNLVYDMVYTMIGNEYIDLPRNISSLGFGAVLLGGHFFLILLGKLFCCLGAGRKS